MLNSLQIHTAPWVVPVSSAAIKNGGVVSDGKRIVNVGRTTDLLKSYPQADLYEHSGLLLPGLINCHIHLELSHLPELEKPSDGKMVDWIERLLQLRLASPNDHKKKYASVEATLNEQFKSGVAIMLNIGNDPKLFPHCPSSLPKVLSHYEVIAPNRERFDEIVNELESLPDNIPVSPHAPYSTSTEAIRYIKKRAKNNQQIISLHLAESSDENTLLDSCEGPFRSFLEKRNAWDDEMIEAGAFKTSVEYLHGKGILDEQTLCVHCVHVNQTDITTLKESGAKVCLCPGSNTFLGVGLAPLPDFLQAGIIPALGTDSRCSNPELCMWKEMGTVKQFFPDIDPHTILEMATQAGAEALHVENDYGGLRRGAAAQFLEVSVDNVEDLSEIEIYHILTSGKKPEWIQWIGAMSENEQ